MDDQPRFAKRERFADGTPVFQMLVKFTGKTVHQLLMGAFAGGKQAANRARHTRCRHTTAKTVAFNQQGIFPSSRSGGGCRNTGWTTTHYQNINVVGDGDLVGDFVPGLHDVPPLS